MDGKRSSALMDSEFIALRGPGEGGAGEGVIKALAAVEGREKADTSPLLVVIDDRLGGRSRVADGPPTTEEEE